MINKYDEDIDVVSSMLMLWKSRFVILSVTVIFCLLSIAYSLIATPKYIAEASIVPVRDSNLTNVSSFASQFGSLGRLAGIDVNSGGVDQDAMAILKSRFLTEKFVDKYSLSDVFWSKAAEPESTWRTVKVFRETVLKISEESTSGVLTIAIEWSDPLTAAGWANDYVSLANEIIRDRVVEQSEKNLAYLGEQIKNTSIVELQKVIYGLIETEIKSLMLANAREEYAFAIVDPAVAPEVRAKPKRKLLVASGTFVGGLLGFIAAISINLFRQVRTELKASA